MTQRLWMFGCALVLGLTLAASADEASAQERAFSKRFDATANGDIKLFGNTSMTCDAALTLDCAAARQGMAVTSQNNNNAHAMTYIDIDADSSTFSSSSASLTLPASATLLWAGLYWGGNTDKGTDGALPPAPANKNQVKLKVPGLPSYQSVTSTVCDTRGDDYQCFAPITTLLSSQLTGEYTVANIQSGTGKGQYGGWSIILLFEDASEPVRNLVVFDGYVYISSTNSIVDVPVSGFLTPPMGPVQSRIGVIGYEGDYNATGDSMRLAGQALSDALNPTSNIFNSSNTALGVVNTDTNPQYPNQLGFDVDLIEATGLIANNATSTTITLRTGGETYYPGAVTIATEIYAPRVEAIKSARDVNGGDLEPGDEVEYSFSLTNEGFDPAEQVTLRDVVPATMTYVPNSITINGAAQTDAADMDLARFDGADKEVIASIGAGATAATGGRMVRGDAPIIVTFRARLNPTGLSSGDQVANQGLVTYRSATLGRDFASLSDAAVMVQGRTPTILTIDQRPPSVTITTPAEGQLTSQTQPAITGKTEPNTSVTITLSSGAQGMVTSDAMGNFSFTPPAPLPQGTYVATATATDAAGNSAEAMRGFTIDTMAPAISLTTPADGSIIKQQRPTITGSTEPGATVTLSIDGGQPTTLTADAQGQFSFTPTRDLGDGMHTVSATARDVAGNSAQAMSSFTIDTMAPALSIDAPTNGASIAQTTPTISGSAEPNATITLSIDNGQPITVTADAQGKWSYNVPTALADGAHTVSAQTEDASGNKANTSANFTVDTQAPTVTITTPADNSTVMSRRPTFSGTADAGSSVELSLGGEVIATVTADERGQWIYTPMMDLADGAYDLQAKATDRAGNSAQAMSSFAVAISPPGMVMISAPLDGATLNSMSDRTIRGRATPNATVTVLVDGQVIGTVTANELGQWSLLPQPPLADGEHTITATVPGDQAEVKITLDTIGPKLTIDSPADGSSPAQNPATITGTTDPNTTVNIFIDSERVGSTKADANGDWTYTPQTSLGGGKHFIAARAADEQGNFSLVEISIIYADASGYVTVGGPDSCAQSPGGVPSAAYALISLLGLALIRRRRRA